MFCFIPLAGAGGCGRAGAGFWRRGPRRWPMCKVLCVDVEASAKDGISIMEAWRLLPISYDRIRELCASGELEAHKSGGWWWVDPESLMACAERLGAPITWEQ